MTRSKSRRLYTDSNQTIFLDLSVGGKSIREQLKDIGFAYRESRLYSWTEIRKSINVLLQRAMITNEQADTMRAHLANKIANSVSDGRK